MFKNEHSLFHTSRAHAAERESGAGIPGPGRATPEIRDDAGFRWLERPGPGAALVFLHGIGSNAGSFTSLFGLLPPDARLLAWNAPGYGGSRPLAADWPLPEEYGDAFSAFLNAAGVERATLVGHSLGTLMAAAFARAHPLRVHRLILAASACGYGVAPGDPLPPAVAARIDDAQRLAPAEFARARAPRLVHDPAAHPQVVAQVERAMAEIDPNGYAQAARMLAAGDLPRLLFGVTVPCGFIHGAEDTVTPAEQTRRAAQAVAGATGRAPPVVSIPGAGHAVYLQKPRDFVAALARLAAGDAARQETGAGAPMGELR